MANKTTLTETKVLAWLLLLSFILGVHYLFLTPPWQAPDEITHYEYIGILTRANIFKIKPKPDYELQKRIIISMDKFNAWKYVFQPRPSSLPLTFWTCPHYKYSNTKVNRPPLYYLLNSILLKLIKVKNLLSKLYLVRLFSLFLSLWTILFVFLAAKIVFDDDPLYSLTATCFVAFLPQFLIISSSINSDSLANLIGAAAIYAYLYLLKYPEKYYHLFVFPVLIGLGLLTGRTTFFIIPSLFILAIIYLYKVGKDNRFLALLSGGIILASLAILFLLFNYVFPELGQKVATNVFDILKIFKKLFHREVYSQFNLLSFQVFFKSFWYYAGWMAFPLPNYIYTILKIFSLLGIVGLLKYIINRFPIKLPEASVRFDYFLLLISVCFLVLAGFIIRLISSMNPVARYIFPALSAFMILFVLGLKELIPSNFKKIILISLIFLFIIFNIYAIFNHHINVFYFHFWP